MFTKKGWKVLGLFAVGIFCLGGHLVYAGIKVTPGAFCVQNLEIGKEIDLGMELVITNDSTKDKLFIVKAVKPSEAVGKWVKGYSEIPDPSWFIMPKEKLNIAAGAELKIPMRINIPNEEKYLNQHWIVYLDITTEEEGPLAFRVAVAPNYMIETKVKKEIKVKPDGVLAISPSMVKFTKEGKEKLVKFKIFNNDKVAHKYVLKTYIPQASAKKQDISVTPGYEFIKNASWIQAEKEKITIVAGGEMEVGIKNIIPANVKANDKGFEGIVYVEPDEGKTGFVRMLIE